MACIQSKNITCRQEGGRRHNYTSKQQIWKRKPSQHHTGQSIIIPGHDAGLYDSMKSENLHVPIY